jgi:hypothetical protein
MEAEMIGFDVILILIVTRVVLPVGILLFLGEWVRRREANYWTRA